MLPEINKILYATDLSESAKYAFGYAMSLANRYGAKITILHVLHLSPTSYSLVTGIIGEKEWDELRQSKEQGVLDGIKDRIKNFCAEANAEVPSCSFITDKIIVKTGNPAEEILRQADAGDYDLVVMGARGHGIITDVMVGSTSRRVVKRCKKPVLVIRLSEE